MSSPVIHLQPNGMCCQSYVNSCRDTIAQTRHRSVTPVSHLQGAEHMEHRDALQHSTAQPHILVMRTGGKTLGCALSSCVSLHCICGGISPAKRSHACYCDQLILRSGLSTQLGGGRAKDMSGNCAKAGAEMMRMIRDWCVSEP